MSPVECFDRERVLFHSEDCAVSVLYPYCRDFGTHHGQYDITESDSLSHPPGARGKCRGYWESVPCAMQMLPEVDSEQYLVKFPLVEFNHLFWAWSHSNGTKPSFEVDSTAESSPVAWSPLESCDWKISTTIQKISENTVYKRHFMTARGMPPRDSVFDCPYWIKEFDSQTHPIEEQGKVGLNGNNDGAVVHLVPESVGLGNTLQCFSSTFDMPIVPNAASIENQNVPLRFNCSLSREQSENNSMMASDTVQKIVHQVEQDIRTLDHKVYFELPTLCDSDGPIAKYRKWSQQLYAYMLHENRMLCQINI